MKFIQDKSIVQLHITRSISNYLVFSIRIELCKIDFIHAIFHNDKICNCFNDGSLCQNNIALHCTFFYHQKQFIDR